MAQYLKWVKRFSDVTAEISCSTGTLFSSMMFPDRAPSDLYLYTTFIGGTQNRELAQASTYFYCSSNYIFCRTRTK